MSEKTEQTEQTEQPAANPELTVVDLQNIRSIIEVAAKRGAFGAGEMAAVGGVFNKLDSFLAAVSPKQEDPATVPA